MTIALRDLYPEAMTTYRELYVHNTDGTGRIERVERDDPVGRRIIDQVALIILARPNVESVSVSTTDRRAMTGGRGRYR